MIGRPRPISTAQALGYFLRESQGFAQLVEHKDFPPELGGDLLARLGLAAGPVTLQEYAAFILGDFPALKTGALRLARDPAAAVEDLQRAVYEVTWSAPKSLSLQLLVAGDKRMHEIVRDANAAAMSMFARYCFARVADERGIVHKVPVYGICYASWYHISSRERDPNADEDIGGGADPQFHVHNLVHRFVLPVGSDDIAALDGRDVQIARIAATSIAGAAAKP